MKKTMLKIIKADAKLTGPAVRSVYLLCLYNNNSKCNMYYVCVRVGTIIYTLYIYIVDGKLRK